MTSRNLRIWQQNCNKSLDAQHLLLNGLHPDYYDIVLIQEPYIAPTRETRARPHWNVLYPTTHNDTRTTMRSIILVNKKISKNLWEQIAIKSPDITAVRIKVGSYTISIYNIYNECETVDTLRLF